MTPRAAAGSTCTSIEQMFQVARLRDDTALLKNIRCEMDEVIIPLTRKMQYMLPLCFGKRSLIQVGAGDTHSLLGTYASLALDLHEWTADATYLEEAKRALRVNAKLPVNTVHQEVLPARHGRPRGLPLGDRGSRRPTWPSARSSRRSAATCLRKRYGCCSGTTTARRPRRGRSTRWGCSRRARR